MRMRHYYGSYQTSLPPLISRPHKHQLHLRYRNVQAHQCPRGANFHRSNLLERPTSGFPIDSRKISDGSSLSECCMLEATGMHTEAWWRIGDSCLGWTERLPPKPPHCVTTGAYDHRAGRARSSPRNTIEKS